MRQEQASTVEMNQSTAALTAGSAEIPAASVPSGSNSSAAAADMKKKGHRRLDADIDDLLEAFLENEGKILRLPVEDDNQINISDLAKVCFISIVINYLC